MYMNTNIFLMLLYKKLFPKGEFTKRVREMSSQLVVALYKHLFINEAYMSLFFRRFTCRQLICNYMLIARKAKEDKDYN